MLLLLGVCAQGYSGKLEIPPKDKTQMITMQDGSTLVGRITSVGENEVKFQTDMGEMTIAIAKIKDVKEVSSASFKGGQYWFPNPNATRLLFGPTGRTLKAEHGYVYDLWVFFPGVAFGLTDHFMIAGGASLIPGLDDQMFYIMPKYGFPAGKDLNFAVSAVAFRLWVETFYFGLGTMTYGSEDRSFTCGLGVAFTDDKMADKPAATLGGEYRLSRHSGLVLESWFIPGDVDEGVIGIGALRLFGEQLTVDAGIGFSYQNKNTVENFGELSEEDEFDWIPYVDFVWNF
ncbi:hypothetical protein C3F09_09610 [candidate division GN15 bacterium]|uniref:Uncharacterized protein n=1 Tax=candidate division GN15 bacterium TaxID=2072418 RepID=A0A855X1S1_9BACT|nr:MAG: hypothetical protein C3F09_09610 [candidate division GN15 bacterium]